jgi:hypothetical protein
MANQQLQSSEWQPSPAQQRVAVMLAQGETQSDAARKTHTALRTVESWWAQREFRAHVYDMMAELSSHYEEEFAQLVVMAMRLEAKALRGEIAPDDPRCRLAHDILTKTAYRIAALRAVHQPYVPAGQPLPVGS